MKAMSTPHFDFDSPQRQSTIAILLVILKTLKVLFRQIALPFFVFVVMGKKGSDYGTYFVVFICSISFISMVYSIINHFRSFYYIANNELVVHSGILGKKKLSIPIERIQTINFEENLIHKLFHVKRLKIDTAGSGEKELELAAIDNPKAEALRNILLGNKEHSMVFDTQMPKREEVIFSLDIPDLIKAGLMENHLRSGGLILVFMWWIYANLQEVGINAEDYIEEVEKPAFSINLFLLGIGFFILVSLIISLFRTVFKYYNLHLSRSGNGFKISQGLLNSKTISALDHKIQTVSWSDNLLKKLMGIHDLKLKQASSKTVESKESIIVPGCSYRHIMQICQYVFPSWSPNLFTFSKVDKSYLYRSYYFSIILGLLAIGISYIFKNNTAIYGIVVLVAFLMVMSYLGYKKLAYGYNREWIHLKGGAFGDKHVVSPIFKTQSLKISQNPFQRRKNLVNLTLFNASGSESIPFIPRETALIMSNYVLFKIEIDKRHWM
ncbi:MAG: PH domain-containing protein [Saprospiraceae bacterium]|nr:PH domain-containing protein [Saprospiraceae bacterium]